MAKGRVIKWSLGILAALIVVCLGAVFYILSTLDFNQFKPEIEKAVLETTGRKLVLAGDVELKLGLSPALVVENVSFANAAWGSRPDLASIQRLEVQVAFIPLFSGSVQLKRFILLEPDILIETNQDGLSNLAFETGTEKPQPEAEKKAPEPGSEKSAAMPSIEIDELVLKNARLTYRDGQTGTSHEVILQLLEASLDKADKLVFSAKGTYNQQPFQLEGETGDLARAFNPKEHWPIRVEAQAGGATAELNGTVTDLTGGTGIEIAFSVHGDKLTDLNTLASAELPTIGKYAISGKISDAGPKVFHIASLKSNLGESDFSGTASLDMNGKRPALSLSLASDTLSISGRFCPTSPNSLTRNR